MVSWLFRFTNFILQQQKGLLPRYHLSEVINAEKFVHPLLKLAIVYASRIIDK